MADYTVEGPHGDVLTLRWHLTYDGACASCADLDPLYQTLATADRPAVFASPSLVVVEVVRALRARVLALTPEPLAPAILRGVFDFRSDLRGAYTVRGPGLSWGTVTRRGAHG